MRESELLARPARRARRARLGWTLARTAQESGLAASSVSNMENSDHPNMPRPSSVGQLEQALWRGELRQEPVGAPAGRGGLWVVVPSLCEGRLERLLRAVGPALAAVDGRLVVVDTRLQSGGPVPGAYACEGRLLVRHDPAKLDISSWWATGSRGRRPQDHLLLLNDDVTFAEAERTLRALRATLNADPATGVVAPRVAEGGEELPNVPARREVAGTKRQGGWNGACVAVSSVLLDLDSSPWAEPEAGLSFRWWFTDDMISRAARTAGLRQAVLEGVGDVRHENEASLRRFGAEGDEVKAADVATWRGVFPDGF